MLRIFWCVGYEEWVLMCGVGASEFNFGSACVGEECVFGAERPGYPLRDVGDEEIYVWLRFMEEQGIDRVLCLLTEQEVKEYYRSDLLGIYGTCFGLGNVFHCPVQDYGLVSSAQFFEKVLPFINESCEDGQKVLVHCSGGSGRTGHVLVLWLIVQRNYQVREAVDAVKETALYRNPLEAVGPKNYEELSNIVNKTP